MIDNANDESAEKEGDPNWKPSSNDDKHDEEDILEFDEYVPREVGNNLNPSKSDNDDLPGPDKELNHSDLIHYDNIDIIHCNIGKETWVAIIELSEFLPPSILISL